MEEYSLDDFKWIVDTDQLLAIIEKRNTRKKIERELINEKRRIKAREQRANKSEHTKSDKKEVDQSENIEVIDFVREEIESCWLVYKASQKEYIYANNIRTWKQFNATAQKYNLSYLDLCKYVIKASLTDKYWCGKITNCKDLYQYYAKIINAFQVNKTKVENSVAVLPWA